MLWRLTHALITRLIETTTPYNIMSESIFGVASLKEFKKIGFIVPSSNVALEIVTTAIVTQLPLVSVHYSRIPVTTTDIKSGAASQFSVGKLVSVAELITNCPVQTVLWNGTSESWTGEGFAGGLRIQEAISTATGLSSSTTSLATVEAIRLLRCKKIGMATPYGQDNNNRLKEYFLSCGIEVVRDSMLGITANNEIADMPITSIKELIRAADSPEVECIVIPCTNFPAALCIEEMERELGKPIVDSIIVTLWKALRLVEVATPIHGWGRLIRLHPVLEQLDNSMSKLRANTNASRTTLRVDCPEHNCHVDRVIAEALTDEIPSLRPNTNLNQRALDTLRFMEKSGVALIQPDTINADVQPPKALMSVYGVRAQMLIPLMEGRVAIGWISVHYVPSTRHWTRADIDALHESGDVVCAILRENGWCDLTLNRS